MKRKMSSWVYIVLCVGFFSCQKNKIQHSPGGPTSERAITPTSNAAPSMHFNQYFSGQSVLKMQKIKVVQTAYAEYFEVNSFTGGYAGLQHTIDSASSGGSTSKTLIASLWDPNTAAGVHAYASFTAPGTYYSRFGGEGDGAKTVNPYGWKINTWYNIVHRSWKSGDSIFIANFIQDLTTGIWFHTSTLSAPGTSAAIGNYNDSFLEDWVGNDDRMDGRYPRKAFFKDCWALSLSGTWLKPNSRNVSVNNSAADVNRNGIYHNSFDAGYDGTEDAFFMAHGAGYTPSSIFAGGRTASLPAQTGQGAAPSLSSVVTDSMTAYYLGGSVYVNWSNTNTSSPQFSYSIDLLNASNTVIHHVLDTMPQQRSASVAKVLADGAYSIRVTIRDIFNNQGTPLIYPLIVNNGSSIKPDARIKWKDIFAGAFITALLFMLGKFGISIYISKTQVGSTYGAAGSLVVLIVWIYYSSIILYLGAEFTKAYAINYGDAIHPSDYAVTVKEVVVETGSKTVQQAEAEVDAERPEKPGK